MLSFTFLALMQAFHSEGIPCRECVFSPWLVLLCICAMGLLFQKIEVVCVDLLRIGLHVTLLAILFQNGAQQTFACSVHALLVCSWALCRDDISSCIVCLFGVCTTLALAHSCSFAVAPVQQLNAMAWPGLVDAMCFVLHRTMM